MKKDYIWILATAAMTTVVSEWINDHERRWVILDKDVKVVREILTAREVKTKINYMCNAGWAKTPDAWVVSFRCSHKSYAKVCEVANKEGVQIFNDNIGH